VRVVSNPRAGDEYPPNGVCPARSAAHTVAERARDQSIAARVLRGSRRGRAGARDSRVRFLVRHLRADRGRERQGLRWITCDLPASGRSSNRALVCTTGGLALSATRVLDELGLDTAHIVGASLGGAIALQAALRVPHRVRSLILMGTTAAGPFDRRLDLGELLAVTARVASGSLRRRRLWLAPAIFSPGFLAHAPDRATALLRLVSAHPPSPWGSPVSPWPGHCTTSRAISTGSACPP